jgi:hypothetical protein
VEPLIFAVSHRDPSFGLAWAIGKE